MVFISKKVSSINKKVGLSVLFLGFLLICFNCFNTNKEDVKISTNTISHIIGEESELNSLKELDDYLLFETDVTTTLELSTQVALSNASNLYIAAEEERVQEDKKRLEEAKAILTYNAFEKSNLTVDQLNNILKGTGLEGYGESYYNMEQAYNVNSMFAIGVAFHESGMGWKKANTNNFYGMRGNKGWMSFDSPDSNIQYFGKLMNKSLYKDKSIVNIGSVYCPGTHVAWASAVKSLMKSEFEKR